MASPQRNLVARFLEIEPHLGRIASDRIAEIESGALSIGVDYSRESTGGGHRVPPAVSVVERLECDKILQAALEFRLLFAEVWPQIRRRHGEYLREVLWRNDAEVGEDRWTDNDQRACLADTWQAICTALRKRL